MRCFIAIDIGEELRKSLRRFQEELAEGAGVGNKGVKWVNPDNIHLTLKFLGEVAGSSTVEVCKIVEQAAQRHDSFELCIDRVGYFTAGNPRVLWVGAADSGPLSRLQQDIESQLAQAGWPTENRQFSAHLTICRIKNRKAGHKLVELLDRYKDFTAGTIQVSNLVVYQSQLRQKGPVYTALGNYKFQGVF